ncbi:hypothetical protein [Halomicrobium urmianum]|uniref:hypothetical protein n=1 Tax=Halomicrobium urmianum TaxID=1586233 RepID=UPI001CDA144F|nr:hypothetical protein [Halomicrobium urmianum]
MRVLEVVRDGWRRSVGVVSDDLELPGEASAEVVEPVLMSPFDVGDRVDDGVRQALVGCSLGVRQFETDGPVEILRVITVSAISPRIVSV